MPGYAIAPTKTIRPTSSRAYLDSTVDTAPTDQRGVFFSHTGQIITDTYGAFHPGLEEYVFFIAKTTELFTLLCTCI